MWFLSTVFSVQGPPLNAGEPTIPQTWIAFCCKALYKLNLKDNQEGMSDPSRKHGAPPHPPLDVCNLLLFAVSG